MHEQVYTQTDMDEFERIALGRKDYVGTLEERRYHRDQHNIVQPNQGGGSNTVKTKEHPEHKQHAQEN